jgi:hypothetical protein
VLSADDSVGELAVISDRRRPSARSSIGAGYRGSRQIITIIGPGTSYLWASSTSTRQAATVGSPPKRCWWAGVQNFTDDARTQVTSHNSTVGQGQIAAPGKSAPVVRPGWTAAPATTITPRSTARSKIVPGPSLGDQRLGRADNLVELENVYAAQRLCPAPPALTWRSGADELACKPDPVPGRLAAHRSAAIHLDSPSPASSVRPTRRHRTGRPRSPAVWPCSGWGLPSHPGHPGCWWSLTPPFHPYSVRVCAGAVCFLWHCPAGRPGLPLTTTLPCGVRTFLGGAP